MITDLCFFAINKSLGIHCESPDRSVGSVRCCALGARPSPGLLLGRKMKESAHACSTHSGGVRCATCNFGNGEAGRALVTAVGYVLRDFAVISPWPACLLAWTSAAVNAAGQGASPLEMSRPCPSCPPRRQAALGSAGRSAGVRWFGMGSSWCGPSLCVVTVACAAVCRRGRWHQQRGPQRLCAGLHLAWPRRGAWRTGRAQACDAQGGAKNGQGQGRQSHAQSCPPFSLVVLQHHSIMPVAVRQVARRGESGIAVVRAA